ncbi:hypothetical protein BCR35DRAFT_302454 [Leucosporidium creatinivorum]|uniref:DUF1295-domain-containing protein n=1 Tax=Leucosporidium creatinivorum TaxID=106004 RepID=A0A1Y2FVK7_9BASI|nr:hypothetical protein BCR35DRAFT_302454 [Leucosporidium creatinivorum]
MPPAPTLTPFFPSHSLLPSLASFPSSLPSLNPADFKQWWLSSTTDPLHPALAFCAGLSALVWVLGEVTGNVSQVDRLWAVLPLMYSAHFTFWPKLTGAAGGQLDQRMLLVFGLQVLWSLRLNTNTWRRGFFNPKSEDYRWEVVRAKIPAWAFKLLNLGFIAITQNILLLAVELPQYLLLTLHLAGTTASPVATALKTAPQGFLNPGLNIFDYGLAAVFVVILVLEMLADNEQQRYQALKARAVSKGVKGEKLTEKEQAAVSRGFVTGGLWSWSRHPNFACEQSTWYILYLFTLLPFAFASFTSHSHSPTTALSAHLPSLKLITHYLTHLPQHLSSGITHLPYLPTTLHEVAELASSTLHATLEALPEKQTVVHAAREAYAVLREDEGVYWNYTIWAPLSMSALFYCSTALTEWISRQKYPVYKQYQRRVGMFWPPITIVKGFWLALTARRGKVDRAVWGIGGGEKMKRL